MTESPFLTDAIIEKAARGLREIDGLGSWSECSDMGRESYLREARTCLLTVLPDWIEAAARVADARSSFYRSLADDAKGQTRAGFSCASGALTDYASVLRSLLPSEPGRDE